MLSSQVGSVVHTVYTFRKGESSMYWKLEASPFISSTSMSSSGENLTKVLLTGEQMPKIKNQGMIQAIKIHLALRGRLCILSTFVFPGPRHLVTIWQMHSQCWLGSLWPLDSCSRSRLKHVLCRCAQTMMLMTKSFQVKRKWVVRTPPVEDWQWKCFSKRQEG